jgi:fatty-acyl-CoA synthase
MGKPIHARAALRLIEAERRTVLHGVPTMFHLLMRETTFNPSRLRTLRGGTIPGRSVSEALVDRVRGWCGVDIAVRGPNVMPGCAHMPAENRRSCKPDAFCLTGDHGIIDENGNAAVDDVCVIGVPQDILGEPVCACIAPVEGVVITGEEVKDFARETVAEYTTPSS